MRGMQHASRGRAVGVALLLATAALLLGAVDAQEVPLWVKPRNINDDQRNNLLKYNRMLVSDANNQNATFDLAWWGDSLTSTVLFYPDALKAWDDHFGFAKNWTAGVLGVGASDVEELFWRMAVGGEKFKNDPLVALLLIGLNNSPTDPRLGYKLDTLLRWIAYRMPKTKVLALAVWPTAKKTSGALLNVFRPILQRRGIEMSLCGQQAVFFLNPADRTMYMDDAIHLTGRGYAKLFDCLLPRLKALRDQQRVKRFGKTW